MIGLGIALFIGVLVGIMVTGLLSGAKNNDLLDEIDMLSEKLQKKR